MEQIVETSPGVGLGQGSASSAGAADEDFTRFFFFALLSRSTGQEVSAQLGGHVSSYTLSAHQMPHAGDASLSNSVEWVQFDDMGGLYFWNRRTRETAGQPPAGVKVVWVGTVDEEGDYYYRHKETHVSTYVLPPLPG